MAALLNRVRLFWIGEQAATATEYALILAFIVAAAWLAMDALGANVRALAQSLSDDLAATGTEAGQVRFLEIGRDNTI
jgi:Flp pilus assembly pilin Flp